MTEGGDGEMKGSEKKRGGGIGRRRRNVRRERCGAVGKPGKIKIELE